MSVHAFHLTLDCPAKFEHIRPLVGDNLLKCCLLRLFLCSFPLGTNYGTSVAGGYLANNETATLNKSLYKGRIWKLWSGSDVIANNRHAGGHVATGEKTTLFKSLYNGKIWRLCNELNVIRTKTARWKSYGHWGGSETN